MSIVKFLLKINNIMILGIEFEQHNEFFILGLHRMHIWKDNKLICKKFSLPSIYRNAYMNSIRLGKFWALEKAKKTKNDRTKSS